MFNRIFFSLFFCWAFLAIKTQAQALQDYDFSIDTVEYRSLDLDYSSIVSVDSFETNTMIPIDIGFSFSFGGKTFNQLIMNPQGGIVMTDLTQFPDKAWTIAGFSTNLIDKSFDGSGVDSKLRYTYDGMPGKRILKMEWYRLGFAHGEITDEIQMQMWLHEGSNKVSLHFGPVLISDSLDIFSLSSGPPVTSLLEIDWNSETATGLYVAGDGNEPTLLVQSGDLAYEYHTKEPDSGTTYHFCPNGSCDETSTSLNDLKPEISFKIGPNPAHEFTQVSAELSTVGDLSIVLMNMSGQVMAEKSSKITTPGLHKLNFNTSHYPAGLYIVRLEWNNHFYIQKLVVRK
jgi:hypothetical protein